MKKLLLFLLPFSLLAQPGVTWLPKISKGELHIRYIFANDRRDCIDVKHAVKNASPIWFDVMTNPSKYPQFPTGEDIERYIMHVGNTNRWSKVQSHFKFYKETFILCHEGVDGEFYGGTTVDEMLDYYYDPYYDAPGASVTSQIISGIDENGRYRSYNFSWGFKFHIDDYHYSTNYIRNHLVDEKITTRLLLHPTHEQADEKYVLQSEFDVLKSAMSDFAKLVTKSISVTIPTGFTPPTWHNPTNTLSFNYRGAFEYCLTYRNIDPIEIIFKGKSAGGEPVNLVFEGLEPGYYWVFISNTAISFRAQFQKR